MQHGLAKHLGRVLHQICEHVCCWLRELLELRYCSAWEGGTSFWGLEAAQEVLG